LAVACRADMLTTLDWQFSTIDNPASPDSSPSTVNPSGGVATATVFGATDPGYYFNARPGGAYGARRGLWDIANGKFQLDLGSMTVAEGQALDYTVKIVQFSGDPGIYPASPIFSLGAAATHTRTTLETVSAGDWVEDTYTWHVTPLSGPLSLSILPDTAGGATPTLLIDSIRWDISGNLMLIPEPSTITIAAGGLALLFVRNLRRR